MKTRAPLGSILVATDFSAHARLALERAMRLPLGVGCSLDLLHVTPGDADARPSTHEQAQTLLDQARDDAARALSSSGGPEVGVVTSVGQGTPFAGIVDRAHHGRAELVVLGRHGERRFRDALIGSTVERVIRHGSVSVLVVASPPETPYRRPLVAVDMSASSRLALELTARICDPALDEISVLHVISMPSRLHVSETQLVPAIERRLDEIERDERAALIEFLATVNLGVRWNLVVKFGDPRTSILEAAKLRDADLISLGTKGRTGLARVLIGSVAEGVLRSAPCDVMVARLPEAHG